VLGALRDGSLPRERYASWQKLQRELRSIAIRADVRLRREERRKWQLRAKEGRARARGRLS
jgi:ribosome biogenesis GTPase